MLKFKAVKYKNRSLGFPVVEDSLPVKVENGTYKLPSEDEILVKVRAAALNPVDLLIKNSLHPWIFTGDKGFGQDYSGDVVAIGSAAAKSTGFAVGDRISGLYLSLLGAGTVSEYIMINPKNRTGVGARKIPDNLSYEEGAAWPLVFGTAQTIFDNVAKGNSFNKVLILGAGTAVGRYCVQLALHVYGSKEIVVTCSARTEKVIRELGATSVIDYTKQKSILSPVLESVKDSGPFDAILDCCGSSDLFPDITTVLKSRKDFGSYITIVGDSKSNFETSSMIGMIVSNTAVLVRILRSKLGYLPYFYTQTFLDPATSWPDKCVENLAKGKIRVFIDSEYPMSETQEAVNRLQSNQASGKVIVKIA